MTDLATIAKTTHLLLRSCRNWFGSHDFIEILPPLLSESRNPLVSSALVTLPGPGRNGSAYLSQVPSLYLVQARSSIDRVFATQPSIRPQDKQDDHHLLQFHYGEALAPGDNLDTAIGLVESLLESILSSGGRGKIEFPLPRIEYDEAAKVAPRANEGYDGAMLASSASSPVIVVHPSPDHEPRIFDVRAREDGRLLSFDVVCPDAGEIMGGSVVETNVAILESRVKKPPYGVSAGTDANVYLSALQQVGRTVRFGYGLERTLQYLLGAKAISDVQPFSSLPNAGSVPVP